MDEEIYKVDIGPTWRAIALGLVSVFIAACGWFIERTLEAHEREFAEIRGILNAYSGIPAELSSIQRAVGRLEDKTIQHLDERIHRLEERR